MCPAGTGPPENAFCKREPRRLKAEGWAGPEQMTKDMGGRLSHPYGKLPLGDPLNLQPVLNALANILNSLFKCARAHGKGA